MISTKPYTTSLVTIDNEGLTKSHPVATMVNGEVIEFFVQWIGISRDDNEKVCGITRVVATAALDAITFLGTGDKIQVQDVEFDVGLDGAILNTASDGLDLSVEVVGLDGQGDMDWSLYFYNIKYHKK